MQCKLEELFSVRCGEKTMGRASDYASGQTYLVDGVPDFRKVMTPFNQLYKTLQTNPQLYLPPKTKGLKGFSEKVYVYVNSASKPRTTHMVAACALVSLTPGNTSFVSQEPNVNSA